MSETFLDIITDVATLAQRSNDSDYLTKIKVWVNISQRILASIYDYWNALKDIYNFTTVASQERYNLLRGFDKPLRVFDITNKNTLDILTEEEYIEGNLGGLTTTGKPNIARIYGEESVDTQLSSAGTLSVVSSSTSDGSAFTVLIRGIVNGVDDYEEFTLNGTTAVSGSKSFSSVTHISKSGTTTGRITITSGGTTIATMEPDENVVRRKRLYLGQNIPADAYSMRMLYKKKVKKMIRDYDFPFVDCSNFLIYDAYGQTLQQDGKDVSASFQFKRAEQEMLRLINNEGGSLGPDYTHKFVSNFWRAHRK
ncbi:MAG: hypothetical protein FJ150_02705 [Euryarchaeota archaeon]|nr:hypothetical protein [Euryarchaeota archaeon]